MIDLLVAMARAAARSNRRLLIFEPYPNIVDPNDRKLLAFSAEVSFIFIKEENNFCCFCKETGNFYETLFN